MSSTTTLSPSSALSMGSPTISSPSSNHSHSDEDGGKTPSKANAPPPVAKRKRTKPVQRNIKKQYAPTHPTHARPHRERKPVGTRARAATSPRTMRCKHATDA